MMEQCTLVYRVEAFYDGQLPAEIHRQMAQHMETCPVCRQEVEALVGVSELFSAAESDELTHSELTRIKAGLPVGRAPSEPSLRLFGGLSAIAASVLVVCGAWWPVAPVTRPHVPYAGAPPAEWERVALDLRVDPESTLTREATASADSNLADWMARGLAEQEDRSAPIQN